MEFRGGTYISQHSAGTINEAVKTWAYNLDTRNIQYLNNKTKQQLIKDLPQQLKEFSPTPIDNLKNIFFFSYQFKTGYVNINIVKTA